MLRSLIAAAIMLAAVISNAEARQRHKPATGLHPECFISMPCIAPYASTPDQVRIARGRYVARQVGFGAAIEKPVRKPRASQQRSEKRVPIPRPRAAAVSVPEPARTTITEIGDSITKPLRYIAGRLICAVNVNAALAERGIKGTGSAVAKSFLKWGRSAGRPVPGAVIVSHRRGGGHVAIVSRVSNGVVYAWNATGGQRDWREIPYRLPVIDYRVPG